MSEVIVKRIVNVPVSTAWEIWDDYGNIAKFAPQIHHSQIIESDANQQTGMGCKRECKLGDGKNWLKEEIVHYEPNKRMGLDIYESSMPMKDFKAIIAFDTLSSEQTAVTFTMQFTPPFGIIGSMVSPLIKMQFSRVLGQMMDGFVEYALDLEQKAA